MSLIPWYQRRVNTDDDEEVTYSHRCSSATPDRWRSLVGGTVYVTSRRLVFIPNALGALLGRKPWAEALGDIAGTRVDMLEATRVFGALPVLRVSIAGSDEGTTRTRTIVMTRSDEVTELEASITRGRL